MTRVAFAAAIVCIACDADRETFDAAPNDASSEQTPACTEFCPASVVGIPVTVTCGDVVDASLAGACADVGYSFTCGDPAHPDAAPFQDCQHVLFGSGQGTCNVEIDFASGFVYAATIYVTQGPGDRCCAGMLTPTPPGLIVDEPDASCDAATD